MKLNLSSILTSKKTRTLLLLTLLSAYQVDGGSQFSECLGIDLYKDISEFATNIADKQLFCCGGSSGCQLAARSIDCRFITGIQCNKIGQSKFCVSKGNSFSKSPHPGHLCGGTLGDIPVTDAIVDDCPSLEVVRKTLNNERTSPTFSWLCCDTNACTVPVNVIIKDRTANTDCGFGQYSLMCFQDNDGLSCTGSIAPNVNDTSQPIGSCILQIVSPNFKTVSSISTPTTTGKTNIPSLSSNDPNLAVKVAIPIGVVVVVATVGGVAYYLIKKRKNDNLPREDRTDNNQQFELQRLQAENVHLQQQLTNQAQIEVNPYQRNHY